jgi:hypothetical protein
MLGRGRVKERMLDSGVNLPGARAVLSRLDAGCVSRGLVRAPRRGSGPLCGQHVRVSLGLRVGEEEFRAEST